MELGAAWRGCGGKRVSGSTVVVCAVGLSQSGAAGRNNKSNRRTGIGNFKPISNLSIINMAHSRTQRKEPSRVELVVKTNAGS